MYSCCDCNEVFNKKFDFIEHQNIHSGETPFMCLKCGKCYSLIQHYENHVREEHITDMKLVGGLKKFNKTSNHSSQTNLFQCSKTKTKLSEISNENCILYSCLKCSTAFFNYNDLNKHLNGYFKSSRKRSSRAKKQKTNLHDHSCMLCKMKFNSLKKLELHQHKIHSFECKKCHKHFLTSDKLDTHACVNFTVNEGFKCSCSKVFTKTEAFKFHIGNKPFSCCSCSMKFNIFTNLIRHIRTHTKQKPYVCKDCGRGFSQSSHLKNHSSLHLGISAMKCNDCDFSCKTFNGLLKHKKKHKEGFITQQNYIDGRKKSTNISICPVCNKQFLFKRNMGMHMKIHTTKVSLCTECGKVFSTKGKLSSHFKACHREPSSCKTCGKVFASAVLLSAHQKIHVHDKSFTCSVCHKMFSIKSYLVQHMKTHSNKKQFSCSKCGKWFKVAVSLKYHSNICSSIHVQKFNL